MFDSIRMRLGFLLNFAKLQFLNISTIVKRPNFEFSGRIKTHFLNIK